MAATTKVSALVAAATGCIPEEPRTPSIAPSLTFSEESEDQEEQLPVEPLRRRRASTRLIAQNSADIQRITGESTAQLIERCCGGGCCMKAGVKKAGVEYESIPLPDNHAFRSLALRIGECPTLLTKITDLPEQTVFFEPPRRTSPAPSTADSAVSVGAHASPTTPPADKVASLSLEDVNTKIQPPNYVQPHPPHHVFAARIDSARELTKPGAEKRTYHFDIDISSYPEEDGTDFKVGGAIGVMAPNDPAMVDDVFDALMVPRFVRDKPVLMKTSRGRWPTYAADENEKKLLMYLCAAEGQGVFCDFRTGPHVSLFQLLSAFPSSHPPLDLLLSVLQPLMPRFYSLSNDPHDSYKTRDGKVHRLVEIAVTVHESADWLHGTRTGIGSGFFERQAQKFLAAQKAGESSPRVLCPHVQGPHGQPPCQAVWVLQGIRDSLVDEIYSGEWGVHEDEVKRVIQSRTGEGRYVQEEVRNQADLVGTLPMPSTVASLSAGAARAWVRAVEDALVDVAMSKGNLEREGRPGNTGTSRESRIKLMRAWQRTWALLLDYREGP
ncbi:sulfite reductase flavoprotein alpha-component [Verticillium dahliae]|nr:sulfite reductase flavoprotein alpha-component [Verticillium dahliae]